MNEELENEKQNGVRDPAGADNQGVHNGSTFDLTDTESHPLQFEWSLWFDSSKGKSIAENWGESLQCVYNFKTIEEFWALYTNIVTPSKLHLGSDIYIFKSTIKPTWERNVHGGGWSYVIQRPKQEPKDKLVDEMWLNVVLAMLSGSFDNDDLVCGAVINVRKTDRLGLWTSNAGNEGVQYAIGRQFKEFLGVADQVNYMTWLDKSNGVTVEKYHV